MNEVNQGQGMLDMVLQMTGNIDNALAFCLENGKQITDDLILGEELKYTGANELAGFWNKKTKPATLNPFLMIEEKNEYFPAFPGMLPMMLS